MAKMVKAKINGLHEIILPDHRAAREEWYQPQGWEKKRLTSIHDNLVFSRSNHIPEVMFYVGAEEGEMSALCQMWGAKVVLFEPNPKAWSHIRSIWEANNLEFPAGIFAGFASDITEKASIDSEMIEQLKIGEDGYPQCSKGEMEAAHGFKEVDKEARYFDQIKIDDYVQEYKIVPTAISLDVEGAEGMVLRGAENTLKLFHPKIWLSGHPEFLHENFNGRAGFHYLRELRDWLKKELGYKEEILDYDHEVHLFYHL